MEVTMLARLIGSGVLATLVVLWSQRRGLRRTLTADIRKKRREGR